MKLNIQQKIAAAVIASLFLVAIGAGVFMNAEPEVSVTKTIALSTSTPIQDPVSTGWWNAIPTDPSLPAMPGGSSSTMTPSTP